MRRMSLAVAVLVFAVPPAHATDPVLDLGKIEAQGSGATGTDLEVAFQLPGTSVDYLLVLDGLVGPTDVVWRAGTASYDQYVTLHVPASGFWRVRLVPQGEVTDYEQNWKTSLFGYSDQDGGVWSQSATALKTLLPAARFTAEWHLIEHEDGNATLDYVIWPLTAWMQHGYLHAKQVVPGDSGWVTLAENWVYSGGQPLQWSVPLQRSGPGPGHAIVGQIQADLLLRFSDRFDDSGHLSIRLHCIDASSQGLDGRVDVSSPCAKPTRGGHWRYHMPSTWPAMPLSEASDRPPPASRALTIPSFGLATVAAVLALLAFAVERRQR